MTGFEKLINLLEKDYYGFLFMAFCVMTAISTCLLFFRKNTISLFFLIYFILDFAMLVFYCYTISSEPNSNLKTLTFISNTIISLVEFLVYYYFFLKIIHNKAVIKLMKLFRVAFVSIIIIFTITSFNLQINQNYYSSNILTVMEFMLLLPPCFVYFYQLFKSDPIIILTQRPSFWIVTGIFFYTLISIPYYLLSRFVYNNEYEYRHVLDLVFFYAPISANFIFLTKGFLCKRTLTT